MKKKSSLTLTVMTVCFMLVVVLLPSIALAQDKLSYSCSNQIYHAFDKEKIAAFTKATGIAVDVHTASSQSCLYRLMNGWCDIASTARELERRQVDYGYTQIAICKDPLAVITRKECEVDNLTEEQLQAIFAGEIKNWQEVGGPDLPIFVIVPGRDTAANKNFRRQIMKHKEIDHQFEAYNSTMVLEAVKYFPCGAVSFISHGADVKYEELQEIKINGLSPKDKDYPYFQIFYYVTKGEQSAAVKKFIDFTFSEAGREIILKNGMLPLDR
jgi:phosphate transport system substrate-binding protein